MSATRSRHRQRRAHPDRELPGRPLRRSPPRSSARSRSRRRSSAPAPSPTQIERVIMGNVLSAGMGQAPARQAVIKAGLPVSTGAITVNKVCGSGLQAVMFARREILVGDAEVIVAGGMESMTNAPYVLPNARGGYRMGNGQIIDSMIHDGLWDPYDNVHMGNCGDLVAEKYGFTREDAGRLRAAELRARDPGPEGRQVQGRDRSGVGALAEGRAGAGRGGRGAEEGAARQDALAQARLLEGRHGDGRERLVDQRRRRGAGGLLGRRRASGTATRCWRASSATRPRRWSPSGSRSRRSQRAGEALREDEDQAARLGPLRDQRGVLGRDDGGDQGARARPGPRERERRRGVARPSDRLLGRARAGDAAPRAARIAACARGIATLCIGGGEAVALGVELV